MKSSLRLNLITLIGICIFLKAEATPQTPAATADTSVIALNKTLAHFEKELKDLKSDNDKNVWIPVSAAILTSFLSVGFAIFSFRQNMRLTREHNFNTLYHNNVSPFRAKWAEQFRYHLSTYVTYAIAVLIDQRSTVILNPSQNFLKKEEAKYNVLFYLHPDESEKTRLIQIIEELENVETVEDFNKILYSKLLPEARSEVVKQWNRFRSETNNANPTEKYKKN